MKNQYEFCVHKLLLDAGQEKTDEGDCYDRDPLEYVCQLSAGHTGPHQHKGKVSNLIKHVSPHYVSGSCEQQYTITWLNEKMDY